VSQESPLDLDALARANPAYVDALYRDYRGAPARVPRDWALLFAGFDLARADGVGARGTDVLDLVHSYRELGHLVADLDPLGGSPREHPLLRLEELGLAPADLDRVVEAGAFHGLGRVPLRALLAALRETYGGTLGVQYMAVSDKARRAWLQARMEPARNRPALDAGARLGVLERLAVAEGFEHFLQARYVGHKRFSLEGAEALVPLLDALIEEGAALGMEELVLGMPHRGRLNVLAHVLAKPYETILAEFEGSGLPEDVHGDGDVKYHLGASHDHRTVGGRTVHLSLSPNPSHLEAVDPVVEGLVRAKQALRGDGERRRVVPILLHGDAAFVGQGVAYETLALSALPGFTTGGTVHVVVDNRIGFTTEPGDYLFSRYPSDPACMLQAPVFHVNADDPEAAVQAARLAIGYRQAFASDVVVDLVCYRRHGHNELDDPSLTQPVLYERIRRHPSVVARYADRLAAEGVDGPGRVAAARQAQRQALERALASARSGRPRQTVSVFSGAWRGLSWAGDDWSARTAVPADRLREVGAVLARLPEGFAPHPRVRRLLEERHRHLVEEDGIDWGLAEHLAYGTLLLEGTPVRLSGQDSQRGTFSHRHAVLFDTRDGRAHVPLNHLAAGQAAIEVVNSPLSEAGVLGFEYGMASADPRRLVIWEAQFGDFVNGAQVVVDQFIASAESKWQRMNGLTLLLPHGYEGQGPEHSSARLERFLQLCAEGNLQVAVPTTPAQLFHLLRRQIHRRFRKPLVVLTPKSLLRHAPSFSRLADFTDGAFAPVLDDRGAGDADAVGRVVLCSGKVYHALDATRAAAGRGDVALVRLEQLYPFPARELAAVLARYPASAEWVWAQEEPANQGACAHVLPRLAALPGARPVRRVAREAAASPATGNFRVHQEEERALLAAALDVDETAAAAAAAPRDGQAAA
jgi:2-oxoglutarate dehydrogenase E1 component